jgi:hypothetical protein
MRPRNSFLLTIFLTLFILASPAYANVGVPMIFITFPGMLLALLPVIAIESKVIHPIFRLAKIQIIKYTAISNSISTVLGIPLAWIAHTALLIGFGYTFSVLLPDINLSADSYIPLALSVTLGAAWLAPFEKNLSWMVPAASLFLLIPYFFASWYVEYRVFTRLIKTAEKDLCRSATLRANLVSYSFLAIVAVVWLITSIVQKKLSFIA